MKKLLNFQIVYLKRYIFLKEPSNANNNDYNWIVIKIWNDSSHYFLKIKFLKN